MKIEVTRQRASPLQEHKRTTPIGARTCAAMPRNQSLGRGGEDIGSGVLSSTRRLDVPDPLRLGVRRVKTFQVFFCLQIPILTISLKFGIIQYLIWAFASGVVPDNAGSTEGFQLFKSLVAETSQLVIKVFGKTKIDIISKRIVQRDFEQSPQQTIRDCRWNFVFGEIR